MDWMDWLDVVIMLPLTMDWLDVDIEERVEEDEETRFKTSGLSLRPRGPGVSGAAAALIESVRLKTRWFWIRLSTSSDGFWFGVVAVAAAEREEAKGSEVGDSPSLTRALASSRPYDSHLLWTLHGGGGVEPADDRLGLGYPWQYVFKRECVIGGIAVLV